MAKSAENKIKTSKVNARETARTTAECQYGTQAVGQLFTMLWSVPIERIIVYHGQCVGYRGSTVHVGTWASMADSKYIIFDALGNRLYIIFADVSSLLVDCAFKFGPRL
jgi:hypothetical protein